MFGNYFKVALRNLGRNKTFSFINILGLALGLACSFLIMLWVHDEYSIDSYHKNIPRIFSVYERQFYDGKIEAFHGTPGVMAPEIKRVIPEIEYASPYAWNYLATFSVGNKIMKKEGNNAGEDFFKIFSYRLIQGNAQNALNSPLNIAISQSMARDFFGSAQAALNKTIRYEDQKDFRVSAVFEDLPAQSSQRFDFITNWEAFLENNEWARNWTNNGPRTYIMLRKDADAKKVESKIKKFLDAYNKEQGKSFYIELGMQRFDQMYLYSNFDSSGRISGGRIEYVKLFSIVAVFILLIACINFMNLTTARSAKRAKEIGIRKVVGAFRYALVKQFLGEAVLISFFAVVVSLLVVSLCLPAFNLLTEKHVTIPFGNPVFWIAILSVALLTGIVAGSYPALFLSGFHPIRVLKGSLKFSPHAIFFRKGLVVFQFVLSIVLIIGTIVISRQVEYVHTKNLGYDKENFIYVPLEGGLAAKYSLFKEKLLKLESIRDVTRISQAPTQIENGTGGVQWEGKDPNTNPMFTQASVGYDFIRTMNAELAAGRDFSRNLASDSASYIINEAAQRKMGFKNAIGQPLTFWQRPGKIIGVVKDFHFNSMHEPIQPIVIRFGENEGWGNALIRLTAGKTPQALAGIEKVWKELNPAFPFSYKFSDQEYSKLYKSERVVQSVSRYFAGIAILICCLGLLGLAIFTAEQRTKEIGIRKVLGASVNSLFALLSRDFLILVLIAFLLASPIAWWIMNSWLQDFEYRISISWWMFIAAGGLALMIALFTISFQALKAAFANPISSLRSE